MDPPVIFKRKGNAAKPVQRVREELPEEVSRTGTDGGVATPETAAEESPSILVAKLKKKIQKSRPKSRLSFGGGDEEDNGETFQLKTSKSSHRVALGTHPAAVASALEQTRISNEGPRYDAEYLKELKASTPSSRPRLPANEDVHDADISMGIGDVSMLSVELETETGLDIPSESSIKVAKEKRERLRKANAAGEEDFISLSVIRRDEGPQGPHPASRLVREEDELGEGDDEYAEFTSAQERIALGKKSRKLEANKRRNEIQELIADAAEEQDEEIAEWEYEQLRRGGLRTPEPEARAKQVYKPAPIPPVTPVPLLGPAISRLSERLTLLTSSHAKNSATLDSLAREREELDYKEKEIRGMVETAEEKRAWFDNFKEWVESIAALLDEKYPMLEELEETRHSLLRERVDMVSKRRRQDDEDDIYAFLGPLPDASSTEPEEVDELGRAVPKLTESQQRRERRVARTARRQLRSSRRSRTTSEVVDGNEKEEEGYSTDSSLAPADANAYKVALQSLATGKKEVLKDVLAEEFRDPEKGRWSTWREKYSDSYIGAWGGLGVVSVWEFWTRLEIVGWDCIEDERALHSFKWYRGLYAYSRPGQEEIVVEERELGPDGDLVASMISTAVIPIICKIIDGGALDVYSLRHIQRIIDLSEEIEASLAAGNVKFQLLLNSVVKAFQNAITDTETSLAKFKSVQPLPGFNPDSVPSRRRFLFRRVKLLKNLLRWRKYAGELFGLDVLVRRLVDICILDVAQSGWDVGGEEVARQVTKLLPVELLPLSLKSLR